MQRLMDARVEEGNCFQWQSQLRYLQNELNGQMDMSSDDPRLFAAEQECTRRLKDVASIYATIIIKNSNYEKTQQERQFFETLYDFTARVLFTSGGSEAIEASMKMARHFQAMSGRPRKTRFAAFDKCFHGMTYGATSLLSDAAKKQATTMRTMSAEVA